MDGNKIELEKDNIDRGESRYGWQFPIPRFKLSIKDILIFHTYACALSLVFLNIGNEQSSSGWIVFFAITAALPMALMCTLTYIFLCVLVFVCKKRDITVKKKTIIVTLLLLIPLSIVILLMIAPGILSFNFIIAIWMLSFPSYCMGARAIIILPLLGYYRKKK